MFARTGWLGLWFEHRLDYTATACSLAGQYLTCDRPSRLAGRGGPTQALRKQLHQRRFSMSNLLAPPPITARPRRPAFTESATARGAPTSIAVQAGSVSTVPMRLLMRWAAAREECVVFDIDGRYSELDLPAPPGRIVDVADSSTDELCEVLRACHRVSVLGFSKVTAASRSAVLGMALSAATAQRARTGRPRWLMIDDAETVLSDPDIPPHALDLSQRGYCLILRSSERLPPSLAATIDVVSPTGTCRVATEVR